MGQIRGEIVGNMDAYGESYARRLEAIASQRKIRRAIEIDRLISEWTVWLCGMMMLTGIVVGLFAHRLWA